MLVLTRKVNESIQVNDSIEVRVVGVSGDRVRLGIKAPLDIRVVRRELKEQTPDHAEADLASSVPP
jgi:carbon storage regulator